MKKLFVLLIAYALITTIGCKKVLNEDLTGKVIGDAALKTQVGLESALTGAYKGLGNTWSTGFFHATATGATMGGDDITTHPGSNKQEFREFDQFQVSSGNSRTGNLYSGCYKSIQGANNVISNYKNATGNAAAINAIAGEAYFIRAFAYYWLTRLYGSIPLLTSPEFSLDLLTIGKTQPVDIYKLIESDLKQAETLLPNAKRDYGRPNAGSAKALLADVYLTEAGWPIKDAGKYPLAAAKAKEVIDNHSIYGFQFVDTFANLFDNDPTKNGTAEDIFNLTANTANGSTTEGNYGWSAMPGDIGGWDDFFAEIKFFNDFPSGPRKDKTFRLTYTLANGTVIPWQQLATKHPYYGKFWVKGDVANWASSLPLVMLRYAHVLTIYAEAKARSGGPDQQAYDAINAIRARAGVAVYNFNSLSASAFADAVVDERKWEFAGERTRWFDLVRLELVEAVNTNKSPDDLQPIGAITKSDYTFPLPTSETLANPNLK